MEKWGYVRYFATLFRQWYEFLQQLRPAVEA